MKPILVIICTLLSAAVMAAPAQGSPPKDIQRFIDNADLCEHMAGEFDSDQSKQRQREIEQAVVKYCGAAQRQLRVLKRKYKNNAGVQKIIEEHAYGSVTDYVK